MRSVLGALLKRWIMVFIDLKPLRGVAYLPRFFRSWYTYARASKSESVRFRDTYPCLTDWTSHTPFDAHYFYQGAWLARELAQQKPASHVDIGSSVVTIGVLSGLVDTIFVDHRPLLVKLTGLKSIAGNVTSLPFGSAAIESLSCLHVIEHIGLGRYGDPIDPTGSAKAAAELQRVLKPGGRLYLSVPIGRERVCFNAHRVFSPQSMVNMFHGMEMVEFAYVNDSGELREKQKPGNAQSCNYGCGMYVFRKSS